MNILNLQLSINPCQKRLQLNLKFCLRTLSNWVTLYSAMGVESFMWDSLNIKLDSLNLMCFYMCIHMIHWWAWKEVSQWALSFWLEDHEFKSQHQQASIFWTLWAFNNSFLSSLNCKSHWIKVSAKWGKWKCLKWNARVKRLLLKGKWNYRPASVLVCYD